MSPVDTSSDTKPDTSSDTAPVKEKSLGETDEITLTTSDLASRCILGVHPQHGFYFQGIQCKKGSIYPLAGCAWSEKGDRGPGVCHNPENPLILPIWEWMDKVGFSEEQMGVVRSYLEKHNHLDTPAGESRLTTDKE